MKYKDMVTVLFEFINASRSRNWLAHLNTLEDTIPSVNAMDRIKCCRILPVYLSDMQALEERYPNIWQFFLNRHFSVQLNHILVTEKGVEHAGEQKNKKLKIQGGITRRESSRNKFFLILHVVSEIVKELREISHFQKKETKIHYALNQNKTNIRSKNIISLAATFDTVKLQFTDREDTNLYNILTGSLFKDNVKRDILSTHVKRKQLYN